MDIHLNYSSPILEGTPLEIHIQNLEHHEVNKTKLSIQSLGDVLLHCQKKTLKWECYGFFSFPEKGSYIVQLKNSKQKVLWENEFLVAKNNWITLKAESTLFLGVLSLIFIGILLWGRKQHRYQKKILS